MLIIEITIGVILFLVGYLLGRLNLIQKALSDPKEVAYLGKPRQTAGWKLHSQEEEVEHPNKPMKVVDIDERKFVTDVDTNSFKSGSKDLGSKTVTKDKVSSSVSKLKKLKGE